MYDIENAMCHIKSHVMATRCSMCRICDVFNQSVLVCVSMH